MQRVLLIAYHFPPLATSGMYRSLQFARYLPGLQWEPVVLTVRPETLPDSGLLDPEPLERLRPGTRVIRIPAPEALQIALRFRDRLAGRQGAPSTGDSPRSCGAQKTSAGWRDFLSDLLSVPDRQVGWVPGASASALRLLGEGGIAAVYSSSPPASSHVAAYIATRLSGSPWVADFRDPWVANAFTPLRRTRVLDPLDRCLERAVVGAADRIIVNTEEMRRDFAERYPDLQCRFVTIPNGYDPEEEIRASDGNGNGRGAPFTITHAGSLYGPRDPSPLLRALRSLIESGRVAPGGIRVLFVGGAGDDERWRDLVSDPPLSQVVRFEPKVPRSEAIRLLRASDLLLLIQTGTDLQIPRKAYEYLAIGRPILALVTGGATESLVREAGFGWVVHPDDPHAIETALLAAIRGQAAPRPPCPERFDFHRLTGELAGVLNEIAT